MTLSVALNDYKTEVICDFMEVYHISNIYNYKPCFIATLLIGLDYNSRFKRKLSNLNYSLSDVLLAILVDNTSLLLWAQTEDGQKNRNKPESIYAKLEGKTKEKNTVSFDTAEEFENYMKKAREGG